MRWAAAALILLTLGAGVVAAQPAARETPAQQLLTEVNRVRAQHKLAPLKADRSLMRAAQSHAEDIARQGRLDHQGSDGAMLSDRAKRVGYAYALVSENLAAGYATASQAVKSWLESPPHRNNLLDPDVRDAGVGYVRRDGGSGGGALRHYWTANFGRRLD